MVPTDSEVGVALTPRWFQGSSSPRPWSITYANGKFDCILYSGLSPSFCQVITVGNSFRSQIGPGIVYLMFDCVFGRGAFLQSLTPVEPLHQKMIHQVWFDWYVPPIFAKFFLLAEAMMVCLEALTWRIQKEIKFLLALESEMILYLVIEFVNSNNWAEISNRISTFGNLYLLQ